MSAARPGRNALGEFIRDDATIIQAVRELRAVVQIAVDRQIRHYSQEDVRAMADGLRFVEAALDIADAGERPGKGATDARAGTG